MAEFDEHRIGVVDRHNPAAHHRAAERMLLVTGLPDRGHLLQVRQNSLDHPRPDILPHPPRPNVHHAHWRLDELQFRQHAKLLGELGAADDRVEKRRMGRIHYVFHDLQPVAWIEIFRARHEPISRLDKAVVQRERRLPVGRPHIGKDDAAVLMGGIGPVTEPVF